MSDAAHKVEKGTALTTSGQLPAKLRQAPVEDEVVHISTDGCELPGGVLLGLLGSQPLLLGPLSCSVLLLCFGS